MLEPRSNVVRTRFASVRIGRASSAGHGTPNYPREASTWARSNLVNLVRTRFTSVRTGRGPNRLAEALWLRPELRGEPFAEWRLEQLLRD